MPSQQGYSVVGLANAKLRYEGIELAGYRQHLDLPYLNRRDNRMTPQAFEAITLARAEGSLLFSTGWAWKITLGPLLGRAELLLFSRPVEAEAITAELPGPEDDATAREGS